MKNTFRRHAAALSIAAMCLGLTACGGGGDGDGPAPNVTKLSADNAMDAIGVAGVALQRSQVDVAQLLGAVLGNYTQQPPAGVYACAKGGTITLARPDALVWRYSADNCDTGDLLLRSGELKLDASLPAGQGLQLALKDLTYGVTGKASLASQAVNGVYNLLIEVTTDLGKRSSGSLAFTTNGRTDQYAAVYIANKTSDSKFLQYGVTLTSPRFAHPLSLVLDDASQTLTVQADDGSMLSFVQQPGGGGRLEVRSSAGAAPLLSRLVTAAELDDAMARAVK